MVAIVLAGIDIARNKGDDLLVAMDIIMLISSVIQILAVAAGWVMILGGLTTGCKFECSSQQCKG